jgi:hypothetical protein
MLRGVNPFVSSEDIDKGSRWAAELDKQLADTQFGIICLTPENLDAPWLMYEAGALAKSVELGCAATVLMDVGNADVKFPLAAFQGTALEQADVFRLVQSLNKRFDAGRHSETQLHLVFDALWPILEAKLGKIDRIPEDEPVPTATRSDRDLLEELIAGVRRMTQAFEGVSHSTSGGVYIAAERPDSPTSATRPPGILRGDDVPILRAAWIETTDPPSA